MESFDLIVIGSGPAGEKGAAQAAYFGKRVALVECRAEVGGAGIQPLNSSQFSRRNIESQEASDDQTTTEVAL